MKKLTYLKKFNETINSDFESSDNIPKGPEERTIVTDENIIRKVINRVWKSSKKEPVPNGLTSDGQPVQYISKTEFNKRVEELMNVPTLIFTKPRPKRKLDEQGREMPCKLQYPGRNYATYKAVVEFTDGIGLNDEAVSSFIKGKLIILNKGVWVGMEDARDLF